MHYKVLVFGNNVDELLAPYNESIEVEPYVVMTYPQMVTQLEKIKNRKVTQEEVLDYYKSYGSGFDENNNLLSIFNPNGKWDWYQIGGRWWDDLGEYGDTVGETNWKNSEEYLKNCADFWNDWVLGQDTNRYKDVFILEDRKYFLEKYKNLEGYLQANTYKTGYALLTPDGVWHEPGQMGYFQSLGLWDDELDFEINAYDHYIKNLPPETPVTVVDCHI